MNMPISRCFAIVSLLIVLQQSAFAAPVYLMRVVNSDPARYLYLDTAEGSVSLRELSESNLDKGFVKIEKFPDGDDVYSIQAFDQYRFVCAFDGDRDFNLQGHRLDRERFQFIQKEHGLVIIKTIAHNRYLQQEAPDSEVLSQTDSEHEATHFELLRQMDVGELAALSPERFEIIHPRKGEYERENFVHIRDRSTGKFFSDQIQDLQLVSDSSHWEKFILEYDPQGYFLKSVHDGENRKYLAFDIEKNEFTLVKARFAAHPFSFAEHGIQTDMHMEFHSRYEPCPGSERCLFRVKLPTWSDSRWQKDDGRDDATYSYIYMPFILMGMHKAGVVNPTHLPLDALKQIENEWTERTGKLFTWMTDLIAYNLQKKAKRVSIEQEEQKEAEDEGAPELTLRFDGNNLLVGDDSYHFDSPMHMEGGVQDGQFLPKYTEIDDETIDDFIDSMKAENDPEGARNYFRNVMEFRGAYWPRMQDIFKLNKVIRDRFRSQK